MVNDLPALRTAFLVLFACACGAPELTYRSDSPQNDAGLDAPADVSPDQTDQDAADSEAPDVDPEASPDAPTDGPQDAPPDVPVDSPLDAPTDSPLDAPTDTPEDTSEDTADTAVGCPSDMITVPRGNGTDYCIDAFEVTQQAYAAWLATSPAPSSHAACQANASFEPDVAACFGGSYTPTTTPNRPVTCIDWCDAYAYCEGMGRRLCGALAGGPAKYNKHADPSESQWMRACSADGTQAYPYSDNYDGAVCNGADSGAGSAVDVGSTSCEGSVAGLMDMSGNVAEWEDCCSGAAPTGNCRIRGGTFGDGAADLRCDAAEASTRTAVRADLGFRCCRD